MSCNCLHVATACGLFAQLCNHVLALLCHWSERGHQTTTNTVLRENGWNVQTEGLISLFKEGIPVLTRVGISLCREDRNLGQVQWFQMNQLITAWCFATVAVRWVPTWVVLNSIHVQVALDKNNHTSANALGWTEHDSTTFSVNLCERSRKSL